MKKTIEVTTTKEVTVCDVCSKELPENDFTVRCCICNYDLCYDCSIYIHIYRPVDFAAYICPRCSEHLTINDAINRFKRKSQI